MPGAALRPLRPWWPQPEAAAAAPSRPPPAPGAWVAGGMLAGQGGGVGWGGVVLLRPPCEPPGTARQPDLYLTFLDLRSMRMTWVLVCAAAQHLGASTPAGHPLTPKHQSMAPPLTSLGVLPGASRLVVTCICPSSSSLGAQQATAYSVPGGGRRCPLTRLSCRLSSRCSIRRFHGLVPRDKLAGVQQALQGALQAPTC